MPFGDECQKTKLFASHFPDCSYCSATFGPVWADETRILCLGGVGCITYGRVPNAVVRRLSSLFFHLQH